jgi:hypothetical protein
MHRFPVVSWHHLNCVPGTAIEESSVRAFADALLATDAEVGIDFDPAEGRVIFIRNPEHTRFNRTVFDTGGRTGATGTTVGCDGKYARPLLTSCLTIALRHGPMFVYDVIHANTWCLIKTEAGNSRLIKYYKSDSNIALVISSTICVA